MKWMLERARLKLAGGYQGRSEDREMVGWNPTAGCVLWAFPDFPSAVGYIGIMPVQLPKKLAQDVYAGGICQTDAKYHTLHHKYHSTQSRSYHHFHP